MEIRNKLKNMVNKTEKIEPEEKIKESDNWVKTWMCIHITKNSYRQRKGKGHAVCNGNKCKIHYDKANPFKHPIKHIIYDSPYRVQYLLAYPIFILLTYAQISKISLTQVKNIKSEINTNKKVKIISFIKKKL